MPKVSVQVQAREAMLRQRARNELRSLEERAWELATLGRKVDALHALEAALNTSASHSLEQDLLVQRRLASLLASAIIWALDYMAEVMDTHGRSKSFQPEREELEAMEDEALDMLSFAVRLQSEEPSSSIFASMEAPLQQLLRGLVSAALGCVYRLKAKLQAALRYLEEAASGGCAWAHIAVLLELGTVRLLLCDGTGALSSFNEAVLAARSATGLPVVVAGHELMNRLDAAQQAVATVFPRQQPKTVSPPTEDVVGATELLVEDAFTPAGDRLPASSPEDDLQDPSCELPVEAEKGSGGADHDDGKALDANQMCERMPRQEAPHGGSQAPATPRRRSPASGPLASLARPISGGEAEVACMLFSAQTLLWPWPEFREALPPSSGRSANTCLPMGAEPTEEALAGLRRHAACLQVTWPQWGQHVSQQDVPGGSAALKECMVLAFANAAIAMSQLAPPITYGQRVLPTLVEGLTVAMVALGAQHSLASKLMRLMQKASHAAETAEAAARKQLAVAEKEAAERCKPKRRPKSAGATFSSTSPYAQSLPRGRSGVKTSSAATVATPPSTARPKTPRGRRTSGPMARAEAPARKAAATRTPSPRVRAADTPSPAPMESTSVSSAAGARSGAAHGKEAASVAKPPQRLFDHEGIQQAVDEMRYVNQRRPASASHISREPRPTSARRRHFLADASGQVPKHLLLLLKKPSKAERAAEERRLQHLLQPVLQQSAAVPRAMAY